MNIVLLEKEPGEAELTGVKLKETFPQHTIILFEKLGDFLVNYGDLSTIDLIITEKILNLSEAREDFDEWKAHLEKLFPDIVANWEGREAAARLLVHLRKQGLNIPMLVYTHSEQEWLDDVLTKDPLVTYCQKEGRWDDFLTAVRTLTRVST